MTMHAAAHHYLDQANDTQAPASPPTPARADGGADPFLALACDYTRAQLALIARARGLAPALQHCALSELAASSADYLAAQAQLAQLAEIITVQSRQPTSPLARRLGELATRLALTAHERVLVAAMFSVDAGLVLNRHLAATPVADGRLDAAAVALLASRDPRSPDPHMMASLRSHAALGRSHVVVCDGPQATSWSHRCLRLADDIVDWLSTGRVPRAGLGLKITPPLPRPTAPPADGLSPARDAAALAATWQPGKLVVVDDCGDAFTDVLLHAAARCQRTIIECCVHVATDVLLGEMWAAANRLAATTDAVLVVRLDDDHAAHDASLHPGSAASLAPLLADLAPHAPIVLATRNLPTWLAGLPHERCDLSQSAPRFCGLATQVHHAPSWQSAVYDDDSRQLLQDIIDACRFRGELLKGWGFAVKLPYGGAVTALLAGPPGTGKTMSAALIAHELGRPLFRVDLARVVSKYIGETEKQLARLFDEAEASGAILLFDEADALFAKRTDVKSSNDRHANLEVNFLLQRLETFGGVVLLTTNHEHLIDAAFKRRLRYRVALPAPDLRERTLLWERLMPAEAPLASDVDLPGLAARFPLTGGHMLNALVRAASRALAAGSAITQAQLIESCHLEQAASGRV
ncbi:MAG: ATP-binding protein [Myxococcales bacterium]|nr:ATP-binding protein [Myxococcales bacterium]